MLLETTILWTPWAVGMADAAVTAYYANNFVTSDLDSATNPKELGGKSGHTLLGLGGATMAVQAWAVFEWIKYVVKREEGKVTTHNRNPKFGRAMKWFWGVMLLFYLVAIVTSALGVHLVTNYGNVDVSININKLNGTFGDALEGMSYSTLAMGGIAFFVYMYAEFFTRRMDEPHPTMIEAHGGD